ncbi:von Willebrand factor type A domain-containing protein [bacterium AH-315-C07]|nr:von Willebrand factor type A domain-containing protein [bacterium AH-315-C07]
METKNNKVILVGQGLIIILLILGLFSFSFKDIKSGRIEGKLIEQGSNKAISYSQVLLKISNSVIDTVFTDSKGFYSFQHLKAGFYWVIVAKPGFAARNIPNVKVEEGKPTKLDIVLSTSGVLQEITLNKTRISPQEFSNMAGAVVGSDMVETMDMEESVAETLSDQIDALSQTIISTESVGRKSRNRLKRAEQYQMSTRTSKPYIDPIYNPYPKPNRVKPPYPVTPPIYNESNREDYAGIVENEYLYAIQDPLSTFSIDVDVASYANTRRFLTQGQLPPKDAVRIEEFINYFNYEYSQPEGKDPFSVEIEASECPWNKKHKLVHIGVQGKDIPLEDIPASNLVFLIDVSGSMNHSNKLPLLKKGMEMLVGQLRSKDRVAIVTYAGNAGLVLESTPGSKKLKILSSIAQMNSGGSTAGAAGIKLAYRIAKENFKKNGNNRIILATDGDFNVGISSNKELEELIEDKRRDNIFLTVLGFGMGNYQDSKLETLADKGNGNYAYIDNMMEAKKVLVKEFGSTMYAIAKDVKIQVEFNPAKVKAYRLVGYENRMLEAQDFNDDKKDAGELGAGHTVTALYEIVPTGVESDLELPDIDDLKYSSASNGNFGNELLTVKLRYKKPKEDVSTKLVFVKNDESTDLENSSNNFKFSASVASFGMILRDSKFKGEITYDDILVLAKTAKGADDEGYRAEFIRLVEQADLISSSGF